MTQASNLDTQTEALSDPLSYQQFTEASCVRNAYELMGEKAERPVFLHADLSMSGGVHGLMPVHPYWSATRLHLVLPPALDRFWPFGDAQSQG